MHWSSAALPTYLYGDKMQGSSVRSQNGNIVLMERPTSVEASSSRPPPVDAWQQAWQAAMPELKRLHTLQKGLSPIPISRVNQFDAARLDVEMTAMLREQLMKVFSLMQPGLLSRYEPELNAFLEFLVFRFSIWLDRPTPGNALMNLRYRDERAFSRLAATGRDRNIILQRENSIGLWPCPSLEQPGECSEEHV
ncbi:hypothetical protein O6H91_Y501600 [Diphasiastrum complanatum]|nr:hypothetical protein O6H91_Y501600 [Diphasiastrum complanatum]